MMLAAIITTFLSAEPGSDGLLFALPLNPIEGSRVFSAKGCAGCHSIQGIGGQVGPDLGKGQTQRPLLDIAGALWNHSPQMTKALRDQQKARPEFTEAEMASVLSFLYYVGSFEKPGEPEVGERLFRGTCSKCHTIEGVGGTVGPKLDDYSRYASLQFFTAGLWNKGAKMTAEMSKQGIERPVYDGRQIANVVAYLRTQRTSIDRQYSRPGNPREGEALFESKRCAECHPFKGRTGVGPNLATRLKGSLTHISGALWNHAPKMWAKMKERGVDLPTLSPEEAADLVTYLYFLQFRDSGGDPERGKVVFREAQCKSCHAGLTGSPAKAPNFVEGEAKFRSPVTITAAMWNHGGKMEKAMEERGLAWPVLRSGELADLVAFLASRPGSPGP
jgi:mono/diheme cytochrome c family protein